jgi:hypothetical protein
MSAANGASEGEQAQRALNGESEVTPGTVRKRPAARSGGLPRVMSPKRQRVELRAVDLESLLEQDHPARPSCGGAVAVSHHRRRGLGPRGRPAVRARRRLPLHLRRRGQYYSLADLRTEHEAGLDAHLTRSIAWLLDRCLFRLNVVVQEGLLAPCRGQHLSAIRLRELRFVDGLGAKLMISLSREP